MTTNKETKEAAKARREQVEAELREKVANMGLGAGQRWATIALSAMAGDQKSMAAVEDLLGREATTLFDLVAVPRAGIDAMTPGERDTFYNKAAQLLGGGVSGEKEGEKYLQNQIGDLRRQKGLTQEQLAREAGVGLSMLQKIENGTQDIARARTESAVRIARALGVTVEDLVSLD